jgi:hypothetical protein
MHQHIFSKVSQKIVFFFLTNVITDLLSYVIKHYFVSKSPFCRRKHSKNHDIGARNCFRPANRRQRVAGSNAEIQFFEILKGNIGLRGGRLKMPFV